MFFEWDSPMACEALKRFEQGYQPNMFKFHIVYVEAIVMFLAALPASIGSACQVLVGHLQRLRFRFARRVCAMHIDRLWPF